MINISNHPSSKWGKDQLEATKDFGKQIIDIPFPPVDPMTTEEGISMLAKDLVDKVILNRERVVHIMGEMTLTYKVVTMLKALNITCVASTTEREVVEDGNTKTVKFNFMQFREY